MELKFDFEIQEKRHEIERKEDWLTWLDRIPSLPINKLPQDCEIKIIPPFRGAIVRFHITKGDDIFISAYLDVFSRLGACPAPYWEVYPVGEDVVGRVDMNDIEGLIKMINESYEEQDGNKNKV
jgi:hypothetical protein